MGDFPPTMPSFFCPSLITSNLMVMIPAISMAPQKEISPSPSGYGESVRIHYVSREMKRGRTDNAREKCRSPTENLAPLTCTGKYTLLPLERFLMSQLPPCSGRPGMVLAPSLPTFAFVSSSAVPACTLLGSGGCATIRDRDVVEISSASRLFHSARISGDGAQPRIPGWMRPAKRTPGMWREEQKMPSKSQMALALFVPVAC